MALIVADRVLETTNSTGTGALALLGAVSGYRDFDSVCANNDTCYYALWAVDGSGNPSGAWEVGLGTFTDTDTLTRTTPAASSNAGAAVNLAAGTKHVMLSATAGYLGTLPPTFASAAEFRTGTEAAKALSPKNAFDAAAYVTLNDSGGNIAVDLSTGFNFTMTMDGDYTLSAPSNGKPGQTGCIVLTQDGTGTQTLAYNAVWKFAGGTDPVLSTAASTVDILFYQVLANGTDVYASLVKGVA